MSGKCTKNDKDFHQFLLLIISQCKYLFNPYRVKIHFGAIRSSKFYALQAISYVQFNLQKLVPFVQFYSGALNFMCVIQLQFRLCKIAFMAIARRA